jgi:hypothetical protein
MYYKILFLIATSILFSCTTEIEEVSLLLDTKPIQTDHCQFEVTLIDENYLLKYTLYKNTDINSSVINEETLLKTDSILVAKEELKIWVEEIAFDQDTTCNDSLSEENIPIKLEAVIKHSDDSSLECTFFCTINLKTDIDDKQIISDKIIALFKQKFDLEEYLEKLGHPS